MSVWQVNVGRMSYFFPFDFDFAFDLDFGFPFFDVLDGFFSSSSSSSSSCSLVSLSSPLLLLSFVFCDFFDLDEDDDEDVLDDVGTDSRPFFGIDHRLYSSLKGFGSSVLI
jgi:hypothetical protein